MSPKVSFTRSRVPRLVAGLVGLALVTGVFAASPAYADGHRARMSPEFAEKLERARSSSNKQQSFQVILTAPQSVVDALGQRYGIRGEADDFGWRV
jgi:hypothetical protein